MTKKQYAIMKAKSESLKSLDEVLIILGFGLMNNAIINFKNSKDKKSLKKYSHLVKSLENKIKIEFNSSQVLKALAIVEDFIKSDTKHNIKVNILYCGIYIITSVNLENVPTIFKSDIRILSDYLSTYIKSYDVRDLINFTDDLINYLEDLGYSN